MTPEKYEDFVNVGVKIKLEIATVDITSSNKACWFDTKLQVDQIERF